MSLADAAYYAALTALAVVAACGGWALAVGVWRVVRLLGPVGCC